MMEYPSFSSSSNSGTIATSDQNAEQSRRSGDAHEALTLEHSRRWHDFFWSGIFIIHLPFPALILGVLGLDRFQERDRLKIGICTGPLHHREHGFIEDYWPLYVVAGGVGTVLGLSWLLLLGSRANQIMKVSVHKLTTYLAVISVLCFLAEQFFWGVVFATGAALQFLHVISVIDRFSVSVYSGQGLYSVILYM